MEFFESKTLRVKYDCGLDDSNNRIYKTKSYSNVRKDASASNLYEVGEAISGLSKHDLAGITTVTVHKLGL